MMSERIPTPTMAITKLNTATIAPGMIPTRYVPMNGSVRPMIEPPIKPAIAPIAASGATYPLTNVAGGVDSVSITVHSVVGEKQIFFTRSTIVIINPPGCSFKVAGNAAVVYCTNRSSSIAIADNRLNFPSRSSICS